MVKAISVQSFSQLSCIPYVLFQWMYILGKLKEKYLDIIMLQGPVLYPGNLNTIGSLSWAYAVYLKSRLV